MKVNAVIAFACFLGACTAIPIQLGIIASNSNELLRINPLTFSGVGFAHAQTASFLPPFLMQQGVDIGLPFNTQMASPFHPQNPAMVGQAGGNPMLFPPGQQEQPQGGQGPQDPNAPQQPRAPSQMVPGYYPTMPFGQTLGQRYPYYYYRYPQPNPNMVFQQTQGVNQMNYEQTTQTPQLPLQVAQTQGQTDAAHVTSGTETRTSAPPPERHGDTPKNNVDDGRSSFSFLFEP